MKNPKNITITEYLERKQKLINTTFIIEAGTGDAFYLSEGVRVPAEEFEKEHKSVVMSFMAFNSVGSDPRREWMNNEK